MPQHPGSSHKPMRKRDTNFFGKYTVSKSNAVHNPHSPRGGMSQDGFISPAAGIAGRGLDSGAGKHPRLPGGHLKGR